MKEDEWLTGILTEETKWNLPKGVAQKLIENGLEAHYGSYSSKVIKAILPFMRNGDDEYTALVKKQGYHKSSDEVSETVALKEKITQLKYQELRNPVVEKAVSQSIRIVNAILKKYETEIDRDKLEIRIESTRELKKPRQEREKLRRVNLDKEKIRQEYADFLNSKKDIIGIKKKVEKYDSLINKFELWLEMGFDKTDESFKEEDFKGFSKVVKLVKAYAVDFCGTKTLRDASREQVENFVQSLADWAEKDRNALLCQLSSYSHPKQEALA